MDVCCFVSLVVTLKVDSSYHEEVVGLFLPGLVIRNGICANFWK